MTAAARSNNIYSSDELRLIPARRDRRLADRRREPRYECQERLFVQVVACADRPDLVGRTEAGDVIDVSGSGIHFCTELELPVGTLVDIWVDIASRPGKFFLSGEVRWNGSAKAGVHACGVELEDGPATDFAAWRALLR